MIGWISSKIRTEKTNKLVDDSLKIVRDGVLYVYQTYVDSIRHTESWNENAMYVAKDKATNYVLSHLSKNMIKYLRSQNISVSDWVSEQIEIAIKYVKDNYSRIE
jgi:hypothetical protein